MYVTMFLTQTLIFPKPNHVVLVPKSNLQGFLHINHVTMESSIDNPCCWYSPMIIYVVLGVIANQPIQLFMYQDVLDCYVHIYSRSHDIKS